MSNSDDSKHFPTDLEAMIGGIARSLAYNGKVREVALLASSQPELRIGNYDNWNGGTYTWDIIFHAPQSAFSQFTPEERKAVEAALLVDAKNAIQPYDNHGFGRIFISTEIKVDPAWREKAKAWVSGTGVTNQGRVRSDNIATRECDGLLFRSQPEINLYKAMKSLGLTLAPLPVFVRGGETYRRIEPDFVIIKNSIVMVVEVDGDTIHHETPAEAHVRTKMLLDEGVKLERIKASECDTPELALGSAKKIAALIEKFGSQR